MLLVLLNFSSCNKHLSNEEDFSISLLNNLIKNDTNELSKVFLNLKDTADLLDSSGYIYIESFKSYSKIDFDVLKKSQLDEIIEWRKKVSSYGDVNKIKFLKVEVDTQELVFTHYEKREEIKTFHKTYPFFKVFFKIDSNEYYFIVQDVFRTKKSWQINRILAPSSKIEDSIKLENRCYKPYKLSFDDYNWRYDIQNKKFSDFNVRISNRTNFDVDYIKYKLVIFDQKDLKFSKIFEFNKTVFAGDNFSFSVPINDFFIEIDPRNGGNFSCNIEVVDAKPKHFD
jgi:hypothetical protein